MSFLQRAFSGISAFLLGVGLVTLADSLVDRTETGHVPKVVDEEYRFDKDHWNLKSVLSKRIDYRINGVGVASNEKSIVQNLGRAMRVEMDSAEYDDGVVIFKDYHFEGLTVGTARADSGVYIVDIIELEGGKWNFEGIGIGSTVSDVKRAFGEPLGYAPDALYYYMVQNGTRLEIEVTNGIVVRIKAGYGRC